MKQHTVDKVRDAIRRFGLAALRRELKIRKQQLIKSQKRTK